MSLKKIFRRVSRDPRRFFRRFSKLSSNIFSFSHLEAGVVAGPAAVVAAVEEAVREQRQVSAGHTLPADLSQLPLLSKERRVLRILTNRRRGLP